MRLILDVELAGDANLALAALLLALRSKPAGEDWRKAPGRYVGIKLDDRFYSIKTTRTGWTVRETR